jgi:type VI secretion system protein ImpM
MIFLLSHLDTMEQHRLKWNRLALEHPTPGAAIWRRCASPPPSATLHDIMIGEPPGFFGKLPARGDFLSRRVPTGVAETWDAWLGMLTVVVREAAGAAWPEAWLTAPLWHFALGADLAPGQGAAGVLVASVDRVGRMFPFTIIGPSAGIPEESWSDAAETLILAALADDFDPALLDDALVRLGPPAQPSALAPGQSLWWCRGSDQVPPTRRMVRGLPSREVAVTMVLGGAKDDAGDDDAGDDWGLGAIRPAGG